MRALSGLLIDRAARPTLQDQLARQIRDRIRSGDLAPGDTLPSTRDLATELKVSRNTAVYAYERLISEGFLQSSPRTGVFVTPSITLPRRSLQQRSAETRAERSLAAQPSLSPPRPFRPCQPDVGLFPLVTWNRMRGRALRREGRTILNYQASCVAGLPALRENVATYLRDHRGVQCDSHQVVITSGSQQALFLLAMLLLKPRDQVYVEDPGYVEARLAFRNEGARIVPGRIDEQGLVLPDPESGRMSAIYTTPSRQFPTGASLSLARRLALIDLASSTRSWIIEDDYDSELRYGAPPLPSLQSLDRSGCVIYTGTFSKILFPSLRLGYVVVPDPLLDRFIELKHLIDDHLPLIDQATLALFLESGAFYSHIRRCRREYAARHALFLDLFERTDLPITLEHSDGGMNVMAFLPDESDDQGWSDRLAQAGFDVPALSHYAIEPTRPGLVFGFTAFSKDNLRAEFKRMRPILEKAASLVIPSVSEGSGVSGGTKQRNRTSGHAQIPRSRSR
jgi:GntR family transcriptional regulator/MocR family aminotransferase